MQILARLLAPLERRDAALLAALLGLLTVYVYQGDADFFTRHLAPALVLGPWAEWAAECWQFAAMFLLLGLLPLAWWRLGMRRPLAEAGLRLGDGRLGLRLLAVALPLAAIPLWVNAGSPAFQAEYPLARLAGASWGHFLAWELCYAVYYLGWEAFFRGFCQIGLSTRLGVPGALAFQAAASTLLHIGKPEGETAAAVIAAFALGIAALRTRSFLYGFLFHWYVGAMTDLFCLLRGGAGPLP